MKKKIGIILLAIILIGLIIGIISRNFSKPDEIESSKFKIVTTFYPIYTIVQNITNGAQNIELVNMTDMNIGCLHDYTLSTTDMKKIENANVIVQNGLGLENFIDKILTTYSDIKVIDSSKNVSNKIEEDGNINSHIWTSINNYITQVEEIANELSDINPENSSIYQENKNTYIQELKDLQSKYNVELENIKDKKVICLNEALSYLLKEVELDVTSVVTNHEESSISAENMKELINKIKNENIKSILVDKQDDLKNAETLVKETGAQIYTLQSGLTGTMDKNAYINIMNENLDVLKSIK